MSSRGKTIGNVRFGPLRHEVRGCVTAPVRGFLKRSLRSVGDFLAFGRRLRLLLVGGETLRHRYQLSMRLFVLRFSFTENLELLKNLITVPM